MLEQDILSSLTPDELALLFDEPDTGVKTTRDPTGYFKAEKHIKIDLVQAAGLLVPWFQDYVERKQKPEGEYLSLQEHMADRYGFGELYEFEGKVDADGVYHSKYEEDPPLHPMLHMKSKWGEMYNYDYGIVALRDNTGLLGDDWFITRMD